MLFVLGKIVFMHTQTAVQNLVFSSSDAVDYYVYRVLARSMNVSAMIIDKGNPQYFEWNLSQCHLFTTSPMWFAPRCTKNKRLSLTSNFAPLYKLLLSTPTLNIARYIADLIVYLRNTS